MKTLHAKNIRSAGFVAAAALAVTTFFSSACVLHDNPAGSNNRAAGGKGSGNGPHVSMQDNNSIVGVAQVDNPFVPFMTSRGNNRPDGGGTRDSGPETRDSGTADAGQGRADAGPETQDGGQTGTDAGTCIPYIPPTPTQCNTTTIGTANYSDYIGVPLRSPGEQEGSEVGNVAAALGIQAPFALIAGAEMQPLADRMILTPSGVVNEYQQLLLKGETGYSQDADTVVLKSGAQFAYAVAFRPSISLRTDSSFADAPDVIWMGEPSKVLYVTEYSSYILAKARISGKLTVGGEPLIDYQEGVSISLTGTNTQDGRSGAELQFSDSCGTVLKRDLLGDFSLSGFTFSPNGRTFSIYIGPVTDGYTMDAKSAEVAVLDNVVQLMDTPDNSGLRTVKDANGQLVAIGQILTNTTSSMLPGSGFGAYDYDQSGNGRGFSFNYEGIDLVRQNPEDYTRVVFFIANGGFDYAPEGSTSSVYVDVPYYIDIGAAVPYPEKYFVSLPGGTTTSTMRYVPTLNRLLLGLGDGSYREALSLNDIPDFYLAASDRNIKLYLSNNAIAFSERAGENSSTSTDPRFDHAGYSPGRFSYISHYGDNSHFGRIHSSDSGAINSSGTTDADIFEVQPGYTTQRGSVVLEISPDTLQILLANRVGRTQFSFSSEATTCTW